MKIIWLFARPLTEAGKAKWEAKGGEVRAVQRKRDGVTIYYRVLKEGTKVHARYQRQLDRLKKMREMRKKLEAKGVGPVPPRKGRKKTVASKKPEGMPKTKGGWKQLVSHYEAFEEILHRRKFTDGEWAELPKAVKEMATACYAQGQYSYAPLCRLLRKGRTDEARNLLRGKIEKHGGLPTGNPHTGSSKRRISLTKAKKHIAILNEMIENAEPLEVPLFRGLLFEEDKHDLHGELMEKLKSGMLELPDLCSFSLDKDIAQQFTKYESGEKKRVILIVNRGKGALIGGNTPYIFEKEYVSRGKYKVLKKEEREGVLYVHLEQVE